MKTRKDLVKESKNRSQKKEGKYLNDISILLYSAALLLFQYLIFELALTQISITVYVMDVSLGLFISFLLIPLITLIYMSPRFEKIKMVLFDNRLNMIALIIALIVIILMLNILLKFIIFKIPFLVIICILILMLVIARIFENLNKKKTEK